MSTNQKGIFSCSYLAKNISSRRKDQYCQYYCIHSTPGHTIHTSSTLGMFYLTITLTNLISIYCDVSIITLKEL